MRRQLGIRAAMQSSSENTTNRAPTFSRLRKETGTRRSVLPGEVRGARGPAYDSSFRTSTGEALHFLKEVLRTYERKPNRCRESEMHIVQQCWQREGVDDKWPCQGKYLPLRRKRRNRVKW